MKPNAYQPLDSQPQQSLDVMNQKEQMEDVGNR